MCSLLLYIIKSITYIHLTHDSAKSSSIKGRYLAGRLADLNSKTPDDGGQVYYNPSLAGELAVISGMCEPAIHLPFSRTPTVQISRALELGGQQ